MSDYEFMPDGSVKADRYGAEVAFFDQDGTVRDRRGGQAIGYVDDNGTVRKQRGGAVLGVVSSDGTVRQGQSSGQVLGKVDPPVHKRGALLLLLG